MKKLLLSIFLLFTLQCERGWLRELLSPTVEGCNIPTACNYNPDVNKFDNSCEYISCIDCKGMMHGAATTDNCGACDAVPSNDCVKDCEGVWGGYKILDCNGLCDGTNLLDHCNVCDADPSNDCEADCGGVWGGSAVKDECDICGGGGSCDCGDGSASCECCCSDGEERDCFGICGGSAVVDQCDVCGGDNSCLPPDLFIHKQSTLFANYFVFSAYDYSGEYLEANQDWIGVFNDDVCVGSALWLGGPTDIPAMGNDGQDYSAGYLTAGDIPTFKIYDASEDKYYDALPNENFGFEEYSVINIIRIDVYVDCLGVIGGTAVIDNCGVCNGDEDCEGVDCTDNPSLYCQDLSVLQIFIDNSLATINMDMDNNGDGIIEPLELGTQRWQNGRLTFFACWWYDGANQNCGLTGEIPTEIGNLVELTYLDFWSNQFVGEIPPEIGNLVKLKRLYISDNQLTGDVPESIGNLTNLISLWLSESQLNGTIPASIGNLTNLYKLHLNDNNLSGDIPKEIGNLMNLPSLNLYNNQLTGEIPTEIGNLVNLTSLNLYNNQLEGSIPKEIGNLVNLTSLNLYNNQLTGEIPTEIGNLVNLTSLWLSNNQLTGDIPPEIGNLMSLMELKLDSNKLSGEIPNEIEYLGQSLWILSLHSNQLAGEIPESICNLEHLVWSSEFSDNQYDSNSYIFNNHLCPPYPSCIENDMGTQNTSNCP